MATNDQVNVEAVQAGLKAVKLLRSSVRDLFKSLADGSLIGQQQDDHQSTEKTFISDVQNSINNISIRIRELESSCTLLAHPVIPVDLGNSGKLGQDPAYERIQLYSSMVSAYRWSDKLHEYASHAYAILNQNSLKRSHPTVQNVTTQMIGGRPARMPVGPLQRRSLTTGHNIQAQQVDNFCSMLQRLFPDMNIEILRPFGNPTHLKITLERVLKAVILLRGLVIEWVIIKGYHEDFVSDDSKFDIWSESRYEVFRKLTEHANAAMLHFYSPIHPDLAIKSFVTWLNSYTSLFSKPCRKCGLRMSQKFMPPTWRDVRNLDVYHEICKP